MHRKITYRCFPYCVSVCFSITINLVWLDCLLYIGGWDTTQFIHIIWINKFNCILGVIPLIYIVGTRLFTFSSDGTSTIIHAVQSLWPASHNVSTVTICFNIFNKNFFLAESGIEFLEKCMFIMDYQFKFEILILTVY